MKTVEYAQLKQFFAYPPIRRIYESFLVLITVIFFTSLVLLIAGAPPFAAYYHIFKGSLGSGRS